MFEQITELPKTSAAIKELAVELVRYLKGNVSNTQSGVDWTWQNFSRLDRFFGDRGCYREFTGLGRGPEFLWDFTAYIPYRGMLLVAESEHDTKYEEIAKDFDRLLYSNAPLKLMMCRIERDRTFHEANDEAFQIQKKLLENVQQNSTNYSGGDVIIVYCVWWALPDGKNRDFAYLIQIDGEPQHRDAKGKSFEPFEDSD